MEDRDLVHRCRAGDESAWTALLDRYAALILSIPRRYGLQRAQCEDVYADVCLTLVKSLGSVRDAQALPQWLIRTTTRATWALARKESREVPPDLPPLTGAAPPEEFVALLEEEQRVRDALESVSERCRKLLGLLYFTAPTPNYDDVARELGVPRGSLGPTRRRCLDRMKKTLVSGGIERPS